MQDSFLENVPGSTSIGVGDAVEMTVDIVMTIVTKCGGEVTKFLACQRPQRDPVDFQIFRKPPRNDVKETLAGVGIEFFTAIVLLGTKVKALRGMHGAIANFLIRCFEPGHILAEHTTVTLDGLTEGARASLSYGRASASSSTSKPPT
jgi:hypothetical protein